MFCEFVTHFQVTLISSLNANIFYFTNQSSGFMSFQRNFMDETLPTNISTSTSNIIKQDHVASSILFKMFVKFSKANVQCL